MEVSSDKNSRVRMTLRASFTPTSSCNIHVKIEEASIQRLNLIDGENVDASQKLPMQNVEGRSFQFGFSNGKVTEVCFQGNVPFQLPDNWCMILSFASNIIFLFNTKDLMKILMKMRNERQGTSLRVFCQPFKTKCQSVLIALKMSNLPQMRLVPCILYFCISLQQEYLNYL